MSSRSGVTRLADPKLRLLHQALQFLQVLLDPTVGLHLLLGDEKLHLGVWSRGGRKGVSVGVVTSMFE